VKELMFADVFLLGIVVPIHMYLPGLFDEFFGG